MIQMLFSANRELKRVPLDFDWELHKVWKGYINPYHKECPHCEHGYSEAYNIIEPFIQNLLWDSRVLKNETLKKILKWLTGREPTSPFGYDGLAPWIAIKKLGTLAKLKDDWTKCNKCNGDDINSKVKEKYDEWKSFEPPKGEGYQLWETTSEGSPITPVFKTEDELLDWLDKNGTKGFTSEFTREDWKKLFKSEVPCVDMAKKLVTEDDLK